MRSSIVYVTKHGPYRMKPKKLVENWWNCVWSLIRSQTAFKLYMMLIIFGNKRLNHHLSISYSITRSVRTDLYGPLERRFGRLDNAWPSRIHHGQERRKCFDNYVTFSSSLGATPFRNPFHNSNTSLLLELLNFCLAFPKLIIPTKWADTDSDSRLVSQCRNPVFRLGKS